MKQTILFLLTISVGLGVLYAATPPGQINYQGVLRDDVGAPLDGPYDLVFSFYDDPAAGTLLLTDTHNAGAPSGQVIVTNGLFTTQLGAGTIAAGSEGSLMEVFRDNAVVWLEIQVGVETLSPRIRVISSAYSLNADHLDGLDSTAFLTGETDPEVGTLTSGKWCSSPDGLVVECSQDAPAGDDGDWTVSGSDIYSAVSGNVGIGTTTPDTLFDVESSGSPIVTIQTSASNTQDTTLRLVGARGSNSTADLAAIEFHNNNDGTPFEGARIALINSDGDSATTTGDLVFYTNDGESVTEKMRIKEFGYIGIGTSDPQGLLDIRTAMILDQSQTSTNSGSSGASIWQSFTAGRTGNLAVIRTRVDYPQAQSVTLRIYEGQGTGGTQIASNPITLPTSDTMASFLVTDQPAITAGNVYTFYINPSMGVSYRYHTGDPYPGGRSSRGVGIDQVFETYVFDPSATTPSLLVTRAGDVGLRTEDPDTDLHLFSERDNQGFTLQVDDNTFSQGIQFRNAGSSYTWRIYRRDSGSNHADLVFANGADSDLTALTDVVTFEDGGQVGIGTTDPAYQLDVTGDIRTTGGFRDAAGDAGNPGQFLTSTGAVIDWADLPAESDPQVTLLTSGKWCTSPDGLVVECNSDLPADADWTVNGDDMYSAVSGLVGIGTATPNGVLDVQNQGQVDQSSSFPPFWWECGGTRWQSFTPAVTSNLISLFIPGVQINMRTIRIYEGEGTGGTELHSQEIMTGSDYAISPPLPLTAETVYTWSLETGGDCIYCSDTDVYSRGVCNEAANRDYFFRTTMGIHPLALRVAGNTRINGNIGISTVPGNAKITVDHFGTGYSQTSDPGTGQTQLDLGVDTMYGYLSVSGSGRQLYLQTDGGGILLDSTGNVGLGVSSPANLLDVNGEAVIGSGYVTANQAAPADGLLVEGNVGIGSVSPDHKLVVDGDARVIDALYDSSNSAGTYGQFLMTTGIGTSWNDTPNDGDWTVSGSDLYSSVSGNVGIGTASPLNKLDISGDAAVGTSYAGVSAAPANGLIVEGNVGIGTDSPGTKLEVRGPIRGGTVDGTEYVQINHGGSNAFINVVGDGDLDFRHDNNTYMALSDTGRLNISGTVSDTAGEGILNLENYANTNHAFQFRIDSTNTDLNLDHYYGGWGTALSVSREYGQIAIGTATFDGKLNIAGGTKGITASGGTYGGRFEDSDSGNYGQVGYSTYKINGTGTVSFVQNHPYEKDRVIIYAAPEGDEAATYTRGTARLVDGAATVQLGETFKWVTNPDIGLTAHITPRGQWADLYVESLTTSEMVIRSDDPGVTDVVFDYLVFGLRIGFEETVVVRMKEEEAMIPAMLDHHNAYDTNPGLRAYNALERYKAMEGTAGLRSEFDLSGAKALHDAIGEFVPESEGATMLQQVPGSVIPAADQHTAPLEERVPPVNSSGVMETGLHEREVSTDESERIGDQDRRLIEDVPVAYPVELGDILVMNPVNGDELYPCNLEADPMVVGISANSGAEGVRMVISGIALVKADATLFPIAKGTLLVASANPGHAVKMDSFIPGTVIGKALEPLDSGTGLIKVLVMMR